MPGLRRPVALQLGGRCLGVHRDRRPVHRSVLSDDRAVSGRRRSSGSHEPELATARRHPALLPKPAHSPSAYLRAYRANVSTTITHPTNEPSADDAAVSVIAMPAGLPNNEMTSSLDNLSGEKSPVIAEPITAQGARLVFCPLTAPISIRLSRLWPSSKAALC
jgi:hypothetical protein